MTAKKKVDRSVCGMCAEPGHPEAECPKRPGAKNPPEPRPNPVHAPTPYRVAGGGQVGTILDAGGDPVAQVQAQQPLRPARPGPDYGRFATTDFVVRACNAHEDLLAAASAMLAMYDAVDGGVEDLPWEALREAAAKARAPVPKDD